MLLQVFNKFAHCTISIYCFCAIACPA